jgi:calcineurin-like phosphoesterase
MKILFVGDVIGRPGRRIVQHKLLELADAHQADLKIVN